LMRPTEGSKALAEQVRENKVTAECVFCNCLGRVYSSNAYAIAIPDNYPISDGHTLIIPRRHVRSIFDLNDRELQSVWNLVQTVRRYLMEEHYPAGFNIGINDGTAAGQTIAHGHVHVIPRYSDDVPDPRGGVRWILPDKAKYWQTFLRSYCNE